MKYSANEVYVSLITAFELGLKVKRGLLDLPLAPDVWIQEICRLRGFQEIAVDSEIASASALLPEIYRDPCDRILVATARRNGLQLVKADEIILQYPGIEVV
jgi:PIN domain nuclease of toxin-antitoxin system